jgi:iron complex outermembrane receptor protein
MLSFRALMLASIPALGAISTPVLAQTPPAEPQSSETAEATIVVTGTRRTDRTLADSPVPIDVIGGDQLAQSGAVETNKVLNALVPSFNFPQPSISDGTDVLRPASLRGLSPDQTLVLVNGKRRHVSSLLNINGTVGRGSAAVDLNTIPALAIERVEVLRDGASSQYGSDAIAGVINIQLKKASSGGRATASYGKYVTTMADVANVTGLQNVGGQPVLDATDSRVFAANTSGNRHVEDGDYYTYGTNIGLPIGPDGYFNFMAEYRDRSATNRAGYDLRPNYARPAAPLFDTRELALDRPGRTAIIRRSRQARRRPLRISCP